MRVLIQRVKTAQVRVKGELISRIGKGLLLFVGVGREDDYKDAQILSKKITALRIFPDEAGKMNLNILAAGGEILSVSQFTLYADIKKGNRPGFDGAASSLYARELWLKLNESLKGYGVPLQEGIFAADMEVELINDGPVTIWLDSREKGFMRVYRKADDFKTENPFFASLFRVRDFIIILILLVPTIIFFAFRFEFNSGNYDVVIKFKPAKNNYCGVNYKNKFEVWTVKGNEINTVQRRIYPP